GYPTSVQAESGDINPETYPTWARITFQFPARDDMPPVKFIWYEGNQGGRRILPPIEVASGRGGRRGGSGGRGGQGPSGGGETQLAAWLQKNSRLLAQGQTLSDSG